MRILVFAAAAALLAAAGTAHAQNSRRDREDPEMVIETGGRMGACDNLQFTPDGKQLLAVGDDKVVRVWSFADGKIDPKSVRALRWGVWREQRGAIYALAQSPDGKRVAIGGLGAATATVAVLDLASGRILDLAVPPNDASGNVGGFWSAAFSPSGERVAFGGGDGSIWLWDFHTTPRTTPQPTHPCDDGSDWLRDFHNLRRLGVRQGGRTFNTVRLLRFTDEDRLLSLAADGELLEWKPNDNPAAPSVLLSLKVNAEVYRAELSPDGRWLAAAVKGPLVTVRSLDGAGFKDITLGDREFPRSLAFDPKNNRLAVGVGSIVPGSRFHIEGDDRIVFYDLDQAPPKPSPGPPHTYRAERLAFHPEGGFLAVAGGDNQEVTLWDLAQADKPASVLRGKGSCLWDVALSESGGAVGFREQHDPASTDPNARGRGPWRAFDLARRQWLAADDFKPVRRLASAGGWTVEPDAHDPYVWYVVHESGARHALPLDRDRDGMPRCWTFLAARGDGPVRLAVGHYWGLSVFEVTKDEARRVRLCVGHQGEVTALAPSADQTWLVSCSNDMTLAAWSLTNEWSSQPLLGASFEQKDDGLVVKAVDPGSPAWEAGLLVKDAIVRFAFAGKWVEGGPAGWLARLKHPVPGLEHAFEVRRGDCKVILLTTLKQRPLWRFFPAGGDEWVVWMWRNCFYDTSTKGDYAIGWHVNAADPKGSPTFYRAEQFRKVFQRPDVINKLLKTRDPGEALALLGDNPLPLHFDDMEPPAAELKLGTVIPGKDVEATMTAYARGDNPDQIPVEAELWINDYRPPLPEKDVQKWSKTGAKRTLTFAIPYDRLRAGRNVVTFQTWNRLGGRADAAAEILCDHPAPAAPQLIGLAVGINDYQAAAPAKNGERALGDLENAVNDAKELTQTWEDQKLYGRKDMTALLDRKATRQAILDSLDDLARRAKPDDRCILFLSGHGDYRAEPADRPGGAPRDVFVFCPPDYNPTKPYTTGITNEMLFEKLAAIPCRKLLILDACRSGAAADNPARGFAPDGQGPVIMAACDLNQVSLEHPTFHHGLFTYAVLEALGDKFADADANHNHLLDVDELYRYTRKRMPKLLELIGRKDTAQVPILFAPEDENYPVASRD